MRKFFIFLILIVFVTLLNCNQLFAAKNDVMFETTSKIRANMWVSEQWFPYTNPDKIQKKIFIIGDTWKNIQAKLKQPWNQYKNVDFIYLPSRYGFVPDCPGNSCNVDNNIVIYLKYALEPELGTIKITLTPDGKMIHEGVTYILVPFDQFDDYYAKYIEPGPDGEQPVASAHATATAKQGPNSPPPPPKENLNKEEQALKEAIEREVKGFEALERAAKESEPKKLSPVLK